MNKTIAVEDNLRPVKDFLAGKGCKIIKVEAVKDRKVDAIVLSGSDENLMGMQDIISNAPVINARGRTPGEVWAEIINQ